MRMALNDKIIKLVDAHAYICQPMHHAYIFQFCGQIKTKVQPLIKSMYRFAKNSKPRDIDNNIRLAFNLKDRFDFIYDI
jgi:hypothetical protein